MNCPHCGKRIPPKAIKSEAARLSAKMGKGGRPAVKDRCPCGLMSKDRAEKRAHKCGKY